MTKMNKKRKKPFKAKKPNYKLINVTDFLYYLKYLRVNDYMDDKVVIQNILHLNELLLIWCVQKTLKSKLESVCHDYLLIDKKSKKKSFNLLYDIKLHITPQDIIRMLSSFDNKFIDKRHYIDDELHHSNTSKRRKVSNNTNNMVLNQFLIKEDQ